MFRQYIKALGALAVILALAFTTASAQEQAAIQEQQDKFMQQLDEKRLKALETINEEIAVFVKSYAESKGIRIVLGTSGTEAVIYGEDELNITREVLTELNRLFLEEK